MKNNQLPEIRFPEFKEAWEQHKLGNVFKKDTKKNKDLEFHCKDIISVSKMKNATSVRDSSDTYMTTYNKIRIGNIAFEGHANKEFPNGRFVLNDLKDGIVSHIYDVYSSISILDKEFIKRYINNPIVMRRILINATSNARMMNSLNSKEFLKQYLLLPNIQEQIKIGSFFKQLDDTIALHQQEFISLKQIKRGFLQKMFPKEGEKFPEVRFPGFTDDWEQRKLSQIADRYDNLRVPITASERISGDTPYYGANGIQDYVKGHTHDGEFILVAEDGANDLKNYPVQYINGKAWVNNHAHVLQSKEDIADNKFLMNAVKHINIEPFLVGGGRAKLNAEIMMKLHINIPSKKEQIQIGIFFKQLDDTIALHQRELEILKNTKKAFLQKMFV